MRNRLARLAAVIGLAIAGVACDPEVQSGMNGMLLRDFDFGKLTSRSVDTQVLVGGAASQATDELLASPRVRERLQAIQAKLPPGQRPLIKIGRIRNDTGLKVNQVDYFVTPIESVLLNSGKADTVSEDKQQVSAGATAQETRLAELTLYGVLSKQPSDPAGTGQGLYTFTLRLADATTGNDLAVSSQVVSKSRADAIGAGVGMRLTDRVDPARVVTVADRTVTINRGENADVAAGQVWEVFARGQSLVDPDSGRDLGGAEVKVGEVEVTDVMAKFATARIVGAKDAIKAGAVVRRRPPDAQRPARDPAP